MFLDSLFGVFEASWGAFWASRGSLGSLWEPLGKILERLVAKLGGLGATFGALQFIIIFWSDFGSKKGAQREAFWEPKRSKNRSKKALKNRCQKEGHKNGKNGVSGAFWAVLGAFEPAARAVRRMRAGLSKGQSRPFCVPPF